MYAERSRWKTEVDSLSETELGGIKEISFTIEGEGPGPGSSLKAGSTGSSGCRRPSPADGSTPPPPLWRCCLRWRRWTSSSTRRTWRCRCSQPPAPGTAREQDLLRGASDPPANRYGGGVPAGAQPVPEPGQGHAPSGLPACTRRSRRRWRGVHRPAPQTGGHRDAGTSGSGPITFPRGGSPTTELA